jgi:hypothetical protein
VRWRRAVWKGFGNKRVRDAVRRAVDW